MIYPFIESRAAPSSQTVCCRHISTIANLRKLRSYMNSADDDIDNNDIVMAEQRYCSSNAIHDGWKNIITNLRISKCNVNNQLSLQIHECQKVIQILLVMILIIMVISNNDLFI